MRRTLPVFQTVAALLLAGMSPGPTASSSVHGQTAPVRVVLVGDSTVTDEAGWGAGFAQLATGGVEVINMAADGRSSKSYIDEGLWAKALARRGQYYLVQFGHNDEPGKRPERETDPATT